TEGPWATLTFARDNQLPDSGLPSIAPAATVTLPAPGNLSWRITGSTAISGISLQPAGTIITLLFTTADTSTVSDGTTLKLNNGVPFTSGVPATNRILTALCDGTKWLEISRSSDS